MDQLINTNVTQPQSNGCQQTTNQNTSATGLFTPDKGRFYNTQQKQGYRQANQRQNPRACFACGQIGHFKRNCPVKFSQPPAHSHTQYYQNLGQFQMNANARPWHPSDQSTLNNPPQTNSISEMDSKKQVNFTGAPSTQTQGN